MIHWTFWDIERAKVFIETWQEMARSMESWSNKNHSRFFSEELEKLEDQLEEVRERITNIIPENQFNGALIWAEETVDNLDNCVECKYCWEYTKGNYQCDAIGFITKSTDSRFGLSELKDGKIPIPNWCPLGFSGEAVDNLKKLNELNRVWISNEKET